MSYVNFESLRSPRDQNIPFLSRKIAIGTGQTLIDTLLTFGLLCKAWRLNNLDGAANLTYRTISPSNTLETILALGEDTDESWTSFFEVNTNAVSGTALLEMELVEPRFAYRNGN